MDDDILTEEIPIAYGPRWGEINSPGLGVEVDKEKLRRYHAEFPRHGQFLPYAR